MASTSNVLTYLGDKNSMALVREEMPALNDG